MLPSKEVAGDENTVWLLDNHAPKTGGICRDRCTEMHIDSSEYALVTFEVFEADEDLLLEKDCASVDPCVALTALARLLPRGRQNYFDRWKLLSTITGHKKDSNSR